MVIIIGIILQIIAAVATIVGGVTAIKNKKLVDFIAGVVAALATMGIGFLTVDLHEPNILRKDDYSAIVLEADKGVAIEYKIGKGENAEWKKYNKPFHLEHDSTVIARTCLGLYKSKETEKEVFVEENGLNDFGGADRPIESLKSLKAEYIYQNPKDGKAGNYYAGYEMTKSDIQVKGTDLNGKIQEVSDFTYSPGTLEKGKNDIEISYQLASGDAITTHLFIEATEPKLLRLNVKYKGGTLFAGTELSNDDLEVKGKYEDGIEKEVTGYSLPETTMKLGKNTIMIIKDGISFELELDAVAKDSITENEKEPNDDISMANDIEPNVKYSGNLKDEEDVDYYKIQLEKKGKIVLNFKHPKIDSDYGLWNISLQGTDEAEKINMNVTGEEADIISNTIRVAPGTYYIRISQYSSEYSSEKYTFLVDYEEEGEYYETEPNDDLASQAMKIKANKTYVGNISDSEDADYYKFILKEKRKVCLKFTHAKLSEDDTLWQVDLLGDEEGRLTDIYSTGQTAKLYSDYVRIPAGTYYIRIAPYGSQWSDIDYRISVITNKEKGRTENEDNDDYGSATRISLGTAVKGNIQSEDDVDFYKIVLKKRTNIKITFSHEPVDSDYTFWTVRLYSEDSSGSISDNEENEAIYINGDSAKNVSSNWRSLPAGTYYVKIEGYGSEYWNDDYKLKVSSY